MQLATASTFKIIHASLICRTIHINYSKSSFPENQENHRKICHLLLFAADRTNSIAYLGTRPRSSKTFFILISNCDCWHFNVY